MDGEEPGRDEDNDREDEDEGEVDPRAPQVDRGALDALSGGHADIESSPNNAREVQESHTLRLLVVSKNNESEGSLEAL